MSAPAGALAVLQAHVAEYEFVGEISEAVDSVAELQNAAQDNMDARDIAHLSDERCTELAFRYCDDGKPTHARIVAGTERRLRAALAKMKPDAAFATEGESTAVVAMSTKPPLLHALIAGAEQFEIAYRAGQVTGELAEYFGGMFRDALTGGKAGEA